MSTAVRTAGSSHSPHRSAAILHEIATQLRIDSVQATTAAASGHPTSCASCAEIMSVLMGDGESAEGSVWEAAELGARYGLHSLCATIDINRLGQSQPTMLQYEMDVYKARWESFGWQALVVDGHDIDALLAAYELASESHDRPTIVLAQTVKGKGLPGLEGKEGEHGKPLAPDDAKRAVAALETELHGHDGSWTPRLPQRDGESNARSAGMRERPPAPAPPYIVGGKPFAPRKAFGAALAAIGRDWPAIVAIDGDVRNSTFTEYFGAVAPERFFEGCIAEQNMVGMAMGLAGTHVGVSIGEDGPSQMGLEDLAMMCAEPNMTVLYPADATSAWRATELVASHAGPCYLRLSRPDAPIIYAATERFEVGRCKVLRQSDKDSALIVAGGVTVTEALVAHDELAKTGVRVRVIDVFSVQPADRDALITAARACSGIVITVEDHYAHGGIGDVVLAALAEERCVVHKLAVREIPHSGKPTELLDRYGISASHIVASVKAALA